MPLLMKVSEVVAAEPRIARLYVGVSVTPVEFMLMVPVPESEPI